MKPVVAIETSGWPGGAALFLPDGGESGGTVTERLLGSASSEAGHARTLVPEAMALVREAGLDADDIGGIAVSVGPGSYTGLRVGVTAAKTLSWALSCELVAVSTLEALAREAALCGPPPGTKRLVPAVDARRGQVYAAFFEMRRRAVDRLSEDAVLTPEDLSRRLERGDHVFGTAPEAFAGILAIPEGATSAAEPAAPRASTVARLGAEMLSRGRTVECHTLAPNYLREWTSPSRGTRKK